MDQAKQSDILILDFSKAFDTVPHHRLLHKLQFYGIQGDVHQWISRWLTDRKQRVVVDRDCSSKVKVKSGVPQGTVLGPLMFLLYINDIGDNVALSLRLFADDSLLYRGIGSITDALKLQEDLDILTDWAQRWQMSFNRSK